ncbi:uncharacterized protein N7515_005157 [Penicillium bovifimosum]|uniref:Uncharacterized protein n=1 Tax=Penicillium bovifimosum TaxID=126998 RepID=A0A9W9H1H0_9EURO|nr:uncharacterized protein N7515_005157 [Penicillium bovifimosum]KAJ5135879.1 hypothetical protein N7515_005157 [Penicillium bovifimosum]
MATALSGRRSGVSHGHSLQRRAAPVPATATMLLLPISKHSILVPGTGGAVPQDAAGRFRLSQFGCFSNAGCSSTGYLRSTGYGTMRPDNYANLAALNPCPSDKCDHCIQAFRSFDHHKGKHNLKFAPYNFEGDDEFKDKHNSQSDYNFQGDHHFNQNHQKGSPVNKNHQRGESNGNMQLTLYEDADCKGNYFSI